MKYYKILNNSEFIGVASSNNFIKYSPIAKCFLRSDEQKGEYINLDSILYRSMWMSPIVKFEPYVEATIIEITEEEYEIFINAIDANETDVIIGPDDEIDNTQPDQEINYIEEVTLEFVRNSKINEMSRACRMTIEAGFDLELRGEMHLFSLTTQDQLNLMSLGAIAQTQSLIPYHADGEETTFYTSDEINTIIQTATELKIYNTTYYNALKGYINSLETIEEIIAITYGVSIPEEYKSEVLKVLE